jgi:tRNA(Ile)-lysidine synthetase-like protein
VQRALLGRAAHRLAPGLRDFGFEAFELARSRLQQRRVGRRTALPGGLELIDEGERVLLHAGGVAPGYPAYPQLATLEPTPILPPARIPLRGGALIVSAEAEPPADLSRAASAGLTGAVWLDGARLEPQLVVRPPRPGDRMRPLGMRGHRKLADIFNSLHIPAGARRHWPVVTSGDEVVWLAGLRIGHEARLTAGTRTAVQLRVELAEEASR